MVRLTTDVHAHGHSRMHADITRPISGRTHGRTYSKRRNGLINNASALHVYAIYRAKNRAMDTVDASMAHDARRAVFFFVVVFLQAYHRQSSDMKVQIFLRV